MSAGTTGDPGPAGDAPTTYAEALAELEDILSRLDRDEVGVDDLARQVARAAELVRYCRGRVDEARWQVETIVAAVDEDGGGGDDPRP